MTEQTRSILDAALALPEDERTLLVERLLERLPPEPEDPTDEGAFAAELDRRRMEVEQGKVTPIPWSELRLEE
jgi:putative addiction module component (TIGR02574 family)